MLSQLLIGIQVTNHSLLVLSLEMLHAAGKTVKIKCPLCCVCICTNKLYQSVSNNSSSMIECFRQIFHQTTIKIEDL